MIEHILSKNATMIEIIRNVMTSCFPFHLQIPKITYLIWSWNLISDKIWCRLVKRAQIMATFVLKAHLPKADGSVETRRFPLTQDLTSSPGLFAIVFEKIRDTFADLESRSFHLMWKGKAMFLFIKIIVFPMSLNPSSPGLWWYYDYQWKYITIVVFFYQICLSKLLKTVITTTTTRK